MDLKISIDLRVHCPELIDAIRDGIVALNHLQLRIQHMSLELDDLTAQVAANTSGVASAVTLINGIADRITAAGADPAKLAELTAQLRSDDETLASAVVANTPAAPPPTDAV